MTTVAYQSKQHTISTVVHAIDDFGFSDQEMLRMELATIYTKGDILITYDGETIPVISPEYGIYLASGTIFSIVGHDNLDQLNMIRAGTTDSLVTVTLEFGE